MIMKRYFPSLLWAMIPAMAFGQQAGITIPPGANPSANLQTVSPLRANAVGGGVRIKDIAYFKGEHPNGIHGIGIVTGLNNTGDKDTIYSKQAIANLLKHYGINVPSSSVSTKNAAVVALTANLNPYAKKGSRIDISINSMGDSTSLTGGFLHMAPLTAGGRVYALASGPLSNNSFSLGTGNAQVTKNHPTGGILINGAVVEREVPVTLVVDGFMEICLRKPDTVLAARMKEAILGQAQRLGGVGNFASAIDGGTIRIKVPDQFRAAPVDFAAQLQAITVVPDSRAVVVMNERTGTIVATSRVRVLSCAVAHGNIYLTVAKSEDVFQPNALSQTGTTQRVPADVAKVTEGGGGLHVFPELPTVQEVSEALNSLGATPRDMMTIFSAMKAAGALQAELKMQ
jgi:flagellar P-ring protein precursor FlgI